MAVYPQLAGTTGTVTGPSVNTNFSFDVVSNTGNVCESNQAVSIPSGGASEDLKGYQVDNAIPSNELHTHNFSQPAAVVQLRIVWLNTMETLAVWLDRFKIALCQDIASGDVAFDPELRRPER